MTRPDALQAAQMALADKRPVTLKDAIEAAEAARPPRRYGESHRNGGVMVNKCACGISFSSATTLERHSRKCENVAPLQAAISALDAVEVAPGGGYTVDGDWFANSVEAEVRAASYDGTFTPNVIAVEPRYAIKDGEGLWYTVPASVLLDQHPVLRLEAVAMPAWWTPERRTNYKCFDCGVYCDESDVPNCGKPWKRITADLETGEEVPCG